MEPIDYYLVEVFVNQPVGPPQTSHNGGYALTKTFGTTKSDFVVFISASGLLRSGHPSDTVGLHVKLNGQDLPMNCQVQTVHDKRASFTGSFQIKNSQACPGTDCHQIDIATLPSTITDGHDRVTVLIMEVV